MLPLSTLHEQGWEWVGVLTGLLHFCPAEAQPRSWGIMGRLEARLGGMAEALVLLRPSHSAFKAVFLEAGGMDGSGVKSSSS